MRRLAPVFIAMLAFAGLLQPVTALAQTACGPSNVRYASSNNTLYVTGPVTCTLTQIDAATTAPVRLVDPAAKTWLLGTNLRITGGATLDLRGSAVGGDVNQLRLRSNNTAGGFIYVRAEYGTIKMDSTAVTSWDEAKNKPDTEYATNGRAFIHVRSFLDPDGVTPRESRMDIANSDIGYLGYYAAESYGLTWKVSGTPGPFDKVNVLGDVTKSRIHHNYFGAYTYGAYGMQWVGNIFNNNVQYGLDPHDDSDRLTIADNYSHHNGNHGIICSQRCDNLIIRNNRAEFNTGHGIMVHRSVVDSLIENNKAISNTDTGIVLFESHRNTVRNNTSSGNRRGIRLSVGSSANKFSGNIVENNREYGLYFYRGSDAPTTGDGRPKDNTFSGDRIAGSGSHSIKLSEADRNVFTSTTFSGNARAPIFACGTGNKLVTPIPSSTKATTGTCSSSSSTVSATTAPQEQPVLDKN